MESDVLHLRLLAAIAALAPALALLLYFSLARSWRLIRELTWLSFGLGFVSAIPIAGIATLYAPVIATIEGFRMHAAAVAFLEAALPEEVGKFLVVVYFVLRHEDLRRPVDAIVLTIMVALGFATIENLYYVFSSPNWGETAMLRAVTAVPMHATIAIVMGYFAARLVMVPRPGWRIRVAMLAWPVLLHGMYDYPVFAVQRLLPTSGAAGQAAPSEFQIVFILAIFTTALSAVFVLHRITMARAAIEPVAWARSSEAPMARPTRPASDSADRTDG